MIGFVYADYLDPTTSDPFHRDACDTFQSLSHYHPGEIVSLVDPNVTSLRLWTLLTKCDFVFYWGHGHNNIAQGAIMLGSNTSEFVPVDRIGRELKSKQIFLDACHTASKLENDDFGDVLLVCPIDSSSYDTSVRMGCSLISKIFVSRLTFDIAFQRTVEELETGNLYKLIGKGHPRTVVVSETAQHSIIISFERLLTLWQKRRLRDK